MGTEELRKRYEDVQSALANVQDEARLALEAVKKKSDVKIQLGNWRERQNRLRSELKIVEAELLQAEIPECQSVYDDAKKDLKSFEAQREAVAIQWRRKMDEVTEVQSKLQILDIRCYGLDQTIQNMIETISEKRKRLAELIREVVSPVEEVQPTIRSNKE